MHISSLEKKENFEIEKYNKEILSRNRFLLDSLNKLNIKDKGLLDCIKNEANKFMDFNSSNIISSNVVDLIVSIDCKRLGINSIEGIEDLINLSHVNLSENPLKTIKPLLHLKKLKSVNLSKVKLSNSDEVFLFNNLKKITPPILSDMYCQDIKEKLDESPIKNLTINVSSLECKGGDENKIKIQNILAKQSLGVQISVEEEVLLLEYKLNQQKKSYKQRDFSVVNAEIFTNKSNGTVGYLENKSSYVNECCSKEKEIASIYKNSEVIKSCFTRSSGDNGLEMFIKEKKIKTNKLSYSCYIPSSIAKSREEIIGFQRTCTQFVSSYLQCAQDIYVEEVIKSLSRQFQIKPKLITVKLDGVKHVAMELNH